MSCTSRAVEGLEYRPFNKSNSKRTCAERSKCIAAPLNLCQAVSSPASERSNALFVVGRGRKVRGSGKGVASVRYGAAPHNKLLQRTVKPRHVRACGAHEATAPGR